MTTSGTIALSAVVMAHPKRQAHAEALCAKYPELGLRLVLDPDPTGPPSSVRAGRLAWLAAAEDCTHHLVLEDDVDLCDGFLDHLRGALAAQPEAVVSLHTACTSRVSFSGRLATMRSSPWAPVIGDYVPTVAAVMPRSLAVGFGAYIDRHAELSDHNDLLLKRYLEGVAVPRLVTVPNLSDHLPFPSIEGNRTPDGRRAMCFDRATGPVEWQRPPVDPPVVPYLGPGPHRHAVAYLRQPDGRVSIRPAVEVMAECGVRLDRLAAQLAPHAERSPRLTEYLGDILFQLWCTAALLGVAYRLTTPSASDPEIGSVLAEPLVRETFESWAGGVVEKRAPETLWPGLRRHLAVVLSAGTRAGADGFEAPAPYLLDRPGRH
ncbi:hypothetical protein [Micromonospora sp. NPDC051141]|uniref:hypothetical protein n=1 Tax=Micromonospora sp. NPDC051141 TaxID=3364284 RepID=UPI0037A03391